MRAQKYPHLQYVELTSYTSRFPQTFFAFPIAFIFCVPPLCRSVAVKPDSRPSLPFPSTTTPRSFFSVSLLLPFCRSFSVGWSLQTAMHALSSFAAAAALAAVANAQRFKFPPGPAVNLPQSSTGTPQQEFRYRGCANLNKPMILSAFRLHHRRSARRN